MDIKEKIGDLFIDIAKLIFAGVILSSIISENINAMLLFCIGIILFFALILCGFYYYKKSKTKSKKRRK